MAARKANNNEQGSAIKRVLRHRDSQEYFKDGEWTDNPSEASNFSDVVEVAETCAKFGLKDVDLALRYETAVNDLFTTPIR